MWVFDRVAKGLLLLDSTDASSLHSPPSLTGHVSNSPHISGHAGSEDHESSTGLPGRWIGKFVNNSGTFFGEDYVTPLSHQEREEHTVWRTHSAFSARCSQLHTLRSDHGSDQNVDNKTHAAFSCSSDKMSLSSFVRASMMRMMNRQTEKASRCTSAGTCCPGDEGEPHDGESVQDTCNSRGVHNSDLKSVLGEYDSWTMSIRLRSNAPQPCMFLSVGPFYIPPPNLDLSAGYDSEQNNDKAVRHAPIEADINEQRQSSQGTRDSLAQLVPAQLEHYTPSCHEQYDRRLLSTPLIAEEPYCVAMECASHGLFLWSDQWNIMGQVVERVERTLDTNCESGSAHHTPKAHLPAPLHGNALDAEQTYTYDQVFRLGWRICRSGTDRDATVTAELSVSTPQAVPSLCTSTTTQGGCGDVRHDAHDTWKILTRVVLNLDTQAQSCVFVPYVTLMEKGDEAILLS